MALIYSGAGVRVLPLRSNSKQPAIKDWPNKATTDPKQINAWFRKGSAYNLGLAMGVWEHTATQGTYLVAIDLDVHDPEKDGVTNWEALVKDNGGDQGSPCIADTATGGVHLVYQSLVPFKNGDNRNLPSGIDVRGVGGCIMVEPSRHPDNGKSPHWRVGASDWPTKQPGLMPTWLVERLQTKPEPAPRPERKPALHLVRGGGDDATRPGDIFNETTDWYELLSGDGWAHQSDGSGSHGKTSRWIRPGKIANSTEAPSATLYYDEGAHGVLVVFSTNCPQELQRPEFATTIGSGYKFTSPWAFEVAMRHGGDFENAARTVGALQRKLAKLNGADRKNAPQVRHDDTQPTSQNNTVNLPAEFWESRQKLTQIRDTAHSAQTSADVVLGCVLAHISALTHWSIKIPNRGTRGSSSLNIFIAPVGPSGSGKSTAYGIAARLIPDTDNERVLLGAPLGSGEGLIEAFFTNVTKTDPKTRLKTTTKIQTRDGVLFQLDEGAAYDQLGDRKGSTLKPTLRQAWGGETLGQTNASQETRRYLEAHHYRMCVVMSFQPAYTEQLLSESDAGTPQRFIWLYAYDPNIPDQTKTSTLTPLDWTPPQPRPYRDSYTTQTLKIDATIMDELWKLGGPKSRGELITSEMDSHRDLQHMKTAALLAILDNRLNITRDDWNLADMILNTSRAVWESCQKHISTKHRTKNDAADNRAINRQVKTEDALDERALNNTERALNNMARAIARRVHKEKTGLTKRDLHRATSSVDRSRAAFEDAIELSVENGWIKQVGDTYLPGESTPT